MMNRFVVVGLTLSGFVLGIVVTSLSYRLTSTQQVVFAAPQAPAPSADAAKG